MHTAGMTEKGDASEPYSWLLTFVLLRGVFSLMAYSIYRIPGDVSEIAASFSQVSWGFRKVEELQEHGARLVVDSPIELATCKASEMTVAPWQD